VATPIASVNVIGGTNFSNLGTPQLNNTYMDDDFNASFKNNVALNSARSNRLDGGGFTESVISDLSV